MNNRNNPSQNLRPGEIAPRSGQYLLRGPMGQPGHEVTIVKGDRMPPGPAPGWDYVLVDPTRNKSGMRFG